MTLDECYQANQGKALLIPGGGDGNQGQCVQWVETVWHDVYGLPYVYTPGAIDFWNKFDQLNLGQYFEKIPAGQPIKKGDTIIYDGRIGSPFGHIDLAAQDGAPSDFMGWDSNWDKAHFHDANGYPTLHEVHHTGILNTYALGYLRLKGSEEQEMPNDGDAINFIRLARGDSTYDPSPQEIENAKKTSFKDWAYSLSTLNDGDAENFLKYQGLAVTDDAKRAVQHEGYKHWAYNFGGRLNADYVPLTQVVYVKK